MATIGEFQRDGDNFTGRIQTLSIDKTVSIERNTEKTSDAAPDFRAFAVSDKDGFKSEIGAGWVKTSKDGNNYMSVSIDSPDLPRPMSAALFNRDENTAAMVWDRPKEQQSALDKAKSVQDQQRSM